MRTLNTPHVLSVCILIDLFVAHPEGFSYGHATPSRDANKHESERQNAWRKARSDLRLLYLRPGALGTKATRRLALLILDLARNKMLGRSREGRGIAGSRRKPLVKELRAAAATSAAASSAVSKVHINGLIKRGSQGNEETSALLLEPTLPDLLGEIRRRVRGAAGRRVANYLKSALRS